LDMEPLPMRSMMLGPLAGAKPKLSRDGGTRNGESGESGIRLGWMGRVVICKIVKNNILRIFEVFWP
jgi:hypothetical protein